MESHIPKDPNDVDATLEAVLDNVKLRNENGRRLTAYRIEAAEIILTYQA